MHTLAALALAWVSAQEPCPPGGARVAWPSDQRPLWSLCVLAPGNSSGPSGSGLEIRDVRFNGLPVLRRAHAPLVDVAYEGTCGCRRGWSDEEAPFEVTGPGGPARGAAGSFAEAVVPPRTACDTGGADVGAFRGVAIERLGDRIVLSTAMASGALRHSMSYTLRLDGTIVSAFAFADAPSACSAQDHRHRVYWRFDLDLGGGQATGDEREEARRVGAPGRAPAGVLDPATRRGYVLVPKL